MNNTRRKQLNELISKIEDVKVELESIVADEEEYRDNMPESLQESERYQKSEDASGSMEEAMELLDEAIEKLEEAKE